jgi:hypothetical protein
MNSLEIMKRHLGKPEEMELDNGEKILISPIPAEFMPEYLVAQMGMQGGSVTTEGISNMEKCIVESLKAANPKDATMNQEEYEKVMRDFASQHFFLLMEKVSEMNRGGLTDKQLQKIAKMQEKVEKGKNAGRDKGDSGKVKSD